MTSSPGRGGLPGLAEIAAEIQALRKNRAFSGDVSGKIGPVLLELAGGDARKANEKLGHELRALAGAADRGDAHRDPRRAGAARGYRGITTYSARKRWLADTKSAGATGPPSAGSRKRSGCSPRRSRPSSTPPRPSDAADDGWYIDHFSAVFMLDGDAPEAIEHRRIVATTHHLTEIALVLDTPRESGQRRLG